MTTGRSGTTDINRERSPSPMAKHDYHRGMATLDAINELLSRADRIVHLLEGSAGDPPTPVLTLDDNTKLELHALHAHLAVLLRQLDKAATDNPHDSTPEH
jgi:hypothetical protein